MAAFVERHIAQVLLIAQLEDGELSLVRFSDGGWGVARNREPLDGCYWTPTQVEPCVKRFMQMTKIEGE